VFLDVNLQKNQDRLALALLKFFRWSKSMPIYTVKGPDGRTYKIQGPPGATADQLGQAITQQQDQPSAQPKPQPESGGFWQGVGNTVAGAFRGAGSIGSTILAPYDVARGVIAGEGFSLDRNRQRREAITEGLRKMGAEPESTAFQLGKIGTEIAGTMGVPGALARTATSAGAAAPVVAALRSGGLASPGLQSAAGNAALRVAGGSAVGGSAAGLVNPDDITTGAVIGGALPVGQSVLRGMGNVTTKVAGMTTGAGDDALSQAYQAGRAGGPQSQVFRENMRGQADMLQVLDDARSNLGQLRADRAAQYKANTANLRALSQPMDLKPIAQAVDNVADDFMFQGQARNPQAAQAVQKARELVDNWSQLDPAQFHTPEGIDALKQQIGALKESIPFEQKSARTAVDRVYRVVGEQIRQADPNYAKAMADYSEASELIDEVTRALSLGERASADTAMRKLQSLMRNNANTNYGARLQSAQALEQQGGRPLMPALAGQAVGSWTPRTMQAATATGLTGALALTGNLPQAALTAASSSPRLMGEAFYGAGRTAGAVNPAVLEALRRGLVVGAPVAATDQ